jgi:hypothetical protein
MTEDNLEKNIEEITVNEEDTRCAPGVNFEDGSCIRLVLLIEYANAYNEEEKDNKIKLYPSLETLNPKKYKKILLKQIKDRLGDTCKSQKCWTTQKFVHKMKDIYKTELQKYTFRPEGPSGRFEWLSNVNIDEVMKQYEHKYPDYKFLGSVPIDFDDFPDYGIRDLDFNKLEKDGKTKIGIIFNLDKRSQGGSHWVSLYADLKECKIYFFDSVGLRPKPEIRKFMRRIGKYCSLKIGGSIDKITSEHNKIQHQFGDSECGVYSINFILRSLRGDSFKDITENPIKDKHINQCRKVYFGNSKI